MLGEFKIYFGNEEISLGKIYDYKVNYSKYVELRAERLEQQMRAYENQQKQIQDTEEFIERFRYKATKASMAQSKLKQIDKMTVIDSPQEADNKAFSTKIQPKTESGNDVMFAENIEIGYEKPLNQSKPSDY